MNRSRRVSALVLLALATGGWGVQRATAATGPDRLALTAGGALGAVVTGTPQLALSGSSEAEVEVARLGGGQLRLVGGPSASLPTAVDFPSYVGTGSYPRAVLSLTPTSGGALDPGADDFQYGAVFRLDGTSSGRREDNGDNILQRGLFSDSSMFKLQVDEGHPSCMVRGSAGRVSVRSDVQVDRGTWYRATCTRVGGRLTIDTLVYGEVSAVRDAATGSAGSLSFPASRPASVGGKLLPSGGVDAGASDQFNGAVAKVFVTRNPAVS
jgi:hypothetical protein